jgi:hypothetical protein
MPHRFRLTTRIFFQLNTCSHSPYVTSSLTRGWVCHLQLLIGSNDAILGEVGWTMVMVGVHHGPEGVSGHLLVVPLSNDSLGVWISMTNQDWQLSSHKGQWHFYDWSLPRDGIMTLGYHYGLLGRMRDSTPMGVASATWVVSLEYHFGAASLQAQHSKMV